MGIVSEVMRICTDMMAKLISFLSTEEGEATVFVVIVLLLRLFVNIKATAIDIKKMLVSIPSEIMILAIGILMPRIVSSDQKSEESAFPLMLVSLVFLILQVALEKHVDDKLSGRIGFGITCLIVLMFLMSIFLYHYVLFGGGTNG